MEREPGKLFQSGTVPVGKESTFRRLLSRIIGSREVPSSLLSFLQRNFKFYLRRLVFGLSCMAVYGLLDRTTVYLQIWPNISAWYPPVGISVALLVGIGPAIIPVIVASGYLAGYVNYHQDVRGLPFLLINPLLPLIYGAASLYLRSKLTDKFRVGSPGTELEFAL